MQTVENFTTHARNGYYDNIVFHRIIKGFMLQTGDPLGVPAYQCSAFLRIAADPVQPAQAPLFTLPTSDPRTRCLRMLCRPQI